MASQHVEVEAAKLLHRLIQESKDEPAKLAMKLYVICQHMKSSGKEHSLPYQVISRAMDTVVSQHRLDIDVLRSSPPQYSGGSQRGNSANERSKDKETYENQSSMSAIGLPHQGVLGSTCQTASSSQTKELYFAGSFQNYGMQNDSNATSDAIDMSKPDLITANRSPMGISRRGSMGTDVHQGSLSQRSSKSFEHESPSSVRMEGTISASSQERSEAAKLDKKTSKKDIKKPASKRKRADNKIAANMICDNPQLSNTYDDGFNSRKGKRMNKTVMHGQLTSKSGENTKMNSAVGQLEHLSSMDGSLRPLSRANQEATHVPKDSNPFPVLPLSKLQEEGEVSSSNHIFGIQKGGLPPSGSSDFHSTSIWNQKVALPSANTGGFAPGHKDPSPGSTKEPISHMNVALSNTNVFLNNRSEPVSLPSNYGNVNIGTSSAFGSFAMAKMGFSAPMHYNHSAFESHDMHSKFHKEKNLETPSGSQFSEKRKDLVSNKTSMKFSANIFAKAATDSENSNCAVMHERMTGFPEKVLKTKGSGIQEQENKESVSGTTAAVQMNQASSVKPNSNSNLFGLISQTTASSNMPFKEHHLKQLRAQCLVFLAFRNNLMPRQLHLEIALGGSFPKEEGIPRGSSDSKRDICKREPANSHESSSMFGRPNEMKRMPPTSSPSGSMLETDSSSKDTENTKKSKKLSNSDRSIVSEDNKRIQTYRQKNESEMQLLEAAESHTHAIVTHEPDSLECAAKSAASHGELDGTDATQQGTWINQASSGFSANKHPKILNSIFPRSRTCNNTYRGSPATATSHLENKAEKVGSCSSQSQCVDGSSDIGRVCKTNSPKSEDHNHGDNYHSSPLIKGRNPQNIAMRSLTHVVNPSKDVDPSFPYVGLIDKISAGAEQIVSSSNPSDACAGNSRSNDRVTFVRKHNTGIPCDSDGLKTLTANNALKHEMENSAEQEEEEKSLSDVLPASPSKYTLLEKWIMDHQKWKLAEEHKWVSKQKNAEEKIKTCFNKLKENVNSAEDIPAKTKNVIELKKLQLLQLQRRLRSEFLNDFFKPITSDMERLKSIKKHKHGRRIKQVEKFEQKMKEERQRRIRERQKEFFGEIEVHRDKLEDLFKIKRERCKGFNKYVKEFHKRKERIHREKIDRIQREKINLLKNNDVEGYLRMIQDAKSDRVKQLLKETEKYLQKLGSKLKDAKATTSRFEMEIGDDRAVNVVEMNDVVNGIEDESDQAQHYLESNEKYYMMAHSVKESINEQPTSLQGGKLREYQMNGLRWLVSLYNNHLNGILADEMGLGKTVQVISLICYLIETKNDMGPFLVVVPSSVLPGWISELSFWAPGINKIAYAGLPEERRRLFKEMIVPQKFNVLLTTYEYLMNKHDRPKLSKIHWHYIIIDEGHRIKNASCKLNADLKQYHSSHRLLLTGTPLQNNLEELWALLNFLLPNIFNSSEDFSQWFNKPFESNGENSADEALLSEEENLLIINRLHQVLRPFVLRRLKHKVENELPEKIERLVRCEASAYQKLLMKRVEENLGSIGSSKGRSIQNTVMELRNICNHPYLSQLHVEEVDTLIPKHYLPPIVRLCGKLEMLDRLLPKLKVTDHRILFFSTMTRLLDVMEEYLSWKRYKYLRLDGQTSGGERGALIEKFNRPGSEYFIFLLSIRAGGVGVNLQAADTVIIFDTDWNPQVDLQAQARAHRIGQKKDVLVLRLETVQSVEEQVRASAEHKLGVANQSITAGFFDNNTSAEDRREYLESLLRECKKEETAHVLNDEALNDLLARSESEIDVFEAVDKQRCEEEAATWQRLTQENTMENAVGRLVQLSMPSRLVTEDDLSPFYQAMKIYETQNLGLKQKGETLGNFDTKKYGRGKRAREVRSYEDQWTEEEFEKLCQADSPESLFPVELDNPGSPKTGNPEMLLPLDAALPKATVATCKETQPPSKRGRGRPKKAAVKKSQPSLFPDPSKIASTVAGPNSAPAKEPSETTQCDMLGVSASLPSHGPAMSVAVKGRKTQKTRTGDTPRGRNRKQKSLYTASAEDNYTCIGNQVGVASKKSEVDLPSDGNVENSKESDLATVSSSTSLQNQEKLNQIIPTVNMQEIGKVAKDYMVKSTLIETTKILGSTICFSEQGMKGEKSGMVQVDSGHMFGSSTPAMSLPMQEPKEKRSHDTSSMDTELNNTRKLVGEEDGSNQCGQNEASIAKLAEKMKPAIENDDTCPPNTKNSRASFDFKSSDKQNPSEKEVCTSYSTKISVTSINIQPCEIKESADKVDGSSSLSTFTDVSGCDEHKAISLSNTTSNKAASDETHSINFVPDIKCQESVNPHKAPYLAHENIKSETLLVGVSSGQINCPPSKDYSTVVPVVSRGFENKALVTRKKAAARETRNQSSSTTAACERRARFAGLKQTESLKMDKKDKSSQAVNSSEPESDANRALPITSGMAGNLEEKYSKGQGSPTLPITMGICNLESDFLKNPYKKLDLSTIEERNSVVSCKDPADIKSKEIKTGNGNADISLIESSHIKEVQPNFTGLSATNTEGDRVGDPSPSTKLSVPEIFSSESKDNDSLASNIEIVVNLDKDIQIKSLKIETLPDTVGKHHSLEQLNLTGHSRTESSTSYITVAKPTNVSERNVMELEYRENAHKSVEKYDTSETPATKVVDDQSVGRDGDLNSTELVSGHESCFDTSARVKVHETSVEGGDAGRIVSKGQCSLISGSKEIIESSRQNNEGDLTVGLCSLSSGFQVDNTDNETSLSLDEKSRAPDQARTDSYLQNDTVLSLTAEVIEDAFQNDDLSLVGTQADTGINIIHPLAKEPINVAPINTAGTANCTHTTLTQDINHSESTAPQPLLYVPVETDATESETESFKETVVLSAEVSISEPSKNPSALIEKVERSENKYSEMDLACNAEVDDDSVLDCLVLAASPQSRSMCGATECMREEPEKEDIASTAHRRDQSMLSCQEIASPGKEDRIPRVHPKLSGHTDVNPDGIQYKNSSCTVTHQLERSDATELSEITPSVSSSTFAVIPSNNPVGAEPVNYVSVLSENSQVIAVCNSKALTEASAEPQMTKFSGQTNVTPGVIHCENSSLTVIHQLAKIDVVEELSELPFKNIMDVHPLSTYRSEASVFAECAQAVIGVCNSEMDLEASGETQLKKSASRRVIHQLEKIDVAEELSETAASVVHFGLAFLSSNSTVEAEPVSTNVSDASVLSESAQAVSAVCNLETLPEASGERQTSHLRILQDFSGVEEGSRN